MCPYILRHIDSKMQRYIDRGIRRYRWQKDTSMIYTGHAFQLINTKKSHSLVGNSTNEFVIISCMHANTEENAGKKMAIFRILRGAYRVLLTTERVEQA